MKTVTGLKPIITALLSLVGSSLHAEATLGTVCQTDASIPNLARTLYFHTPAQVTFDALTDAQEIRTNAAITRIGTQIACQKRLQVSNRGTFENPYVCELLIQNHLDQASPEVTFLAPKITANRVISARPTQSRMTEPLEPCLALVDVKLSSETSDAPQESSLIGAVRLKLESNTSRSIVDAFLGKETGSIEADHFFLSRKATWSNGRMMFPIKRSQFGFYVDSTGTLHGLLP